MTLKTTAIIVLALLFLGAIIYYRLHPLTAKVVTPNRTFLVELAVTPEQRERGLGYRDRMEPHHGMLFVFDHTDRFGFWMKGMRFPLDFVWLYGNRIVDITHDVPTTVNGGLPVYQPSAPVDRMLEINAGEASEAGLKIGDTVLYQD